MDPAPTAFTRFMSLLHKLIDYGQRLTNGLQHAGHILDPADRFLRFGTTDLRLILARIKRGLLRAQALQASLQNDPTPRHTRAEREETENAALLAQLPTVEEIARQISCRTPGDVLLDIARDLGIIPGHPLYMELDILAITHGGNTVPVSQTFLARQRDRPRYIEPDPEPESPLPPPEPALLATGPPS